jgi:hypothetical protein
MRRFLLGAVVLILGVGCRDRSTAGQWDSVVQGFLDGYFELNPNFAVYQGKHEFDGKFPDWSREGIKRQTAWLHSQRDRVAAFDTAQLDGTRRFQRGHLLSVIDRELFWIESAEWPFTNPYYYDLDPNIYIARPYAGPDKRMRSLTVWANNLPAALAQMRETLRTPMPGPYIEIGKLRFGDLLNFLEHDARIAFADVGDSVSRRGFETARLGAIQSIRSMDRWLDSLRTTATQDFDLGPDLFRKMLWMTERVDISVDSLESMARKDLEYNRRLLDKACATYAPKSSVRQCIAQMRGRKPTGSLVEEARTQVELLRRFMIDSSIVSIPDDARVDVRECPPSQRWSFFIDVPGPYESALPLVYCVVTPESSWPPAERAANTPSLADFTFVSAHEVWPGHLLQALHTNRSKNVLGQVFIGYAFSEGWAHYAEELVGERSFAASRPEVQVGHALYEMYRDVRLIGSIAMHVRGKSQQDVERMFREDALQDSATARSQAERGTFDPAYINYTLGKLLIRQLREDWTATRGGRSAWREFHDRFLSYGGAPIPLIGRAMISDR